MAELSTLGGVIKTAYEGESNTNAFTDSDKAAVGGIPTKVTDLSDGGDYAKTSQLFDGAYASLSGTPDIPEKVSDLSDGGDYAETSQLFDGAYASLSGTPDIPEKVSDLSDGDDCSTTCQLWGGA